ncbi:hypothetical protein HF521_012688 [Silurus meridionalis]|uniref:Uncharacterized protein n=1 Tax=Silurus meridionalis TaxID=175797 RepID=A0A8T0AD48_SILME|nr:hypothetical protein HF521_012688 [Silurus meridionalis]
MLPASEELYVEVTKYNPPFQVTVFAAEACVPTCPLSSPISHTAWLPWCPERAPPSCQRPWRILYVLPWLDLDLRNRVMEAQKITDELFSDDGEGGAGGELNQIDLDLMDDYPTSDPRWAESVPDKNAGFPLTSLILLHKLAVSLKNHHSKQPELVNAAIAVTLSKTAKSAPSSLTESLGWRGRSSYSHHPAAGRDPAQRVSSCRLETSQHSQRAAGGAVGLAARGYMAQLTLLLHAGDGAHHTLYSQANSETRYFSKKKTLLALSKLTALASDMPEPLQRQQVNVGKPQMAVMIF